MNIYNCVHNLLDHVKDAPPSRCLGQRDIPSRSLALHVVNAKGRERSNARAFDRFFRNRVKQLGTFLPPSPDAPEPDTALLWTFLARQLAEGITNEAEVLPRARVTTPGASAPGSTPRAPAGPAGKAARNGVVIAQPRPFPDARRTVACPPLPGLAPAPTSPSGASPPPLPASSATTPGSPAPAAAAAGPASSSSSPCLVHVFWDVESAHPGDRDPRLAAAEVQQLARRLGRVVGCYAYATRGAWAWVPTYFLNHYVAESSEEEEGGGGGGGEAGAGRGGGGGGGAAGRVRCPVCGRPLAAARLEQHIRSLHPDKPAALLASAALSQEEDEGGLQQRGEEGEQEDEGRRYRGRTGAAAAAASAGHGAKQQPRPQPQPKKAKTNSYRTGLGAVRAYYSSGGEVYRPPAGHQLGLKYVVQREGFEPRVVQNADGAADRAVNGGIDRLLAALRSASRARGAAAGAFGAADLGWAPPPPTASSSAELQYTLVLVSGSARHAAALRSCAQLGVRTVVVAAGSSGAVAEVAEVADAQLSWELLAGGAYRW